MPFFAYEQDFSLTAGGTQSISASGAYLKLLRSTGPVKIVTNTGITMTLSPGQGFRRQDFSRIEVQDKSGAYNKGAFLIASEDMVDDRIAGEVSVVDGGRYRTAANLAFWGSMNVPSGVYYGTVQLYNNSTTRNIVVESIGLGLLGGSAASMHIGVLGAPLAGGTNQGAPRSKKAGGALSPSAQIWTATPAASLFPWMVDIYCNPNDTKFLKLNEPIVVPPGFGLCVDCGAQNQSMAVNFEFYEEQL